MRRVLYIYILLCVTLLSSCYKTEIYVDDPTTRANMGEVEQTTIMYFMGTSLSSYYNYYNLPAVRTAVKNGALGSKGRLFVFIPSSSYEATLYEIYATNSGGYDTQTIATYSDMSPKQSLKYSRLSEVITTVQDFASASTYNLILSGHGTGWVLQTHPYLTTTMSTYINNSIWDKEEGAEMTRFMGSSSDGYMEISELRAGLESTNTKFGYLLFDMCFMSNIETLYELRNACDNIVASPAEVMGVGFPYSTVIPELFENDGASYDLNGACYAFYRYYYTTTSSYNSGTVAWCVTSYLEELALSVKAINTYGVNDVDINDLQCYERMSSHVFCDLKNYVEEACKDSDLYDNFEQALDNAFPPDSRYHTASFYSALSGASGWTTIDSDNYCGVSTSDSSTKFQVDWAQTSWGVATVED